MSNIDEINNAIDALRSLHMRMAEYHSNVNNYKIIFRETRIFLKGLTTNIIIQSNIKDFKVENFDTMATFAVILMMISNNFNETSSNGIKIMFEKNMDNLQKLDNSDNSNSNKSIDELSLLEESNDKLSLLEERCSTSNNLASKLDLLDNKSNLDDSKSKELIKTKQNKFNLPNDKEKLIKKEFDNSDFNKKTSICKYLHDYHKNTKLCKDNFAHSFKELKITDCDHFYDCKNYFNYESKDIFICYKKHYKDSNKKIEKRVENYIDLLMTGKITYPNKK